MVLSSGSWWRRARSREDGGYEGFTIAAVCERARVAPTALYARITPKNALFLAVYEHEHGIARLRVEQEVFADEAQWTGLAPAELVRTAVAEMGRHLAAPRAVSARRHAGLGHARGGPALRVGLRPGAGGGVRGSGAPGARGHPTRRPGGRRPHLLRHGVSASIIRVAYGSDFATPVPVGDDAFVADLGETAVRYLLAGAVG
jgi:AcrR family transcriptional regulator